MRYGVWAPIPMWVGSTRKWSPGRAGRQLTAVVIHKMEGTLDGSDSYLRREFADYSPFPRLDASTHFGIGAWGSVNRLLGRYQIRQWVDTVNSAFGWAARPTDQPTLYAVRTLGADLYRPSADLNWQVIHIEVEGYHDKPWTSGQVSKLRELLAAIGRAHGPLTILYHTDCALKPCPGVYWTDRALPGLHGARIPTLPDTALPEDEVYEWIERMENQKPKVMEIPKGVPVFRAPGEKPYATSPGTKVTLVGQLEPEGLWAFPSTNKGMGLVRKSQAGEIGPPLW